MWSRSWRDPCRRLIGGAEEGAIHEAASPLRLPGAPFDVRRIDRLEQPPVQAVELSRVLRIRGEVAPLSGIVREVVQVLLVAVHQDVLPRALAHQEARRMDALSVILRDHRVLRCPVASQRGTEVHAVEVGGLRSADEGRQCGQQIHEADGRGDSAPWMIPGPAMISGTLMERS